MGFPGGSDSKEYTCNVGDLGSISGLGRFPWRRAWQPTLVFLPGESPWTEEPDRGPWGLKEWGMTEHSAQHSTAIRRYGLLITTAGRICRKLDWVGKKHCKNIVFSVIPTIEHPWNYKILEMEKRLVFARDKEGRVGEEGMWL